MRAWSGEPGGAGGDDVMGDAVACTTSPKPQSPPLKNGSDLRESGYLIAVGSRSARFRRKHREKIFLLVLCLFVILLLSLAITMTVLYVKQKKHELKVCRSKQCLRSAATLAVSMDRTADPCQDFYQYVCGKWSEEHPRPDAYRSYDWFRDKQSKVYSLLRDYLASNASAGRLPRPVQQARTMYSACLDTELLDKLGISPALEVLAATGLPVIPTYLNASEEQDYSNYSFDWLQTVINVKTYLGMDVIIGFDIFSDPKNSSVYRLVLGSPENTNPFPSMYTEKKKHTRRRYFRRSVLRPQIVTPFDVLYEGVESSDTDEAEEKNKQIFIIFYAELIKLLVLESGGHKNPNMTETEFDQNALLAAQEYYSLYSSFYELETENITQTEDMNFLVPEYTAAELQAHTDVIVENNEGTSQPIWRRYLEGVFSISDVHIDFDKEKILVSDPDLKYMSLAASFISKQPPVKLELYIWMKVVEVVAAHTTSDLRALYQRSREVREGRHRDDTGVPPRSMLCAAAVNDMLGMAVATAIADPNFFNVTKPKVQTMLDEMKNALSRLVGRTKWMDDNTKLATYEKILEMRSLIGFPDWFNEENKLEEYYEGIEVHSKKHLHNMLNIIQVRMKKALNRYPDIRNYSWATDPTEVNAYHSFQENTITIPMVMLQYPFYDLGLDSLNYGSLGTIIGHEITHGFDNFGRQFDKDGNMLPWWSNDTIDSFVNMSQCFVEQYSTFYLPELEQHVDGKKTLGENIADNGGVREALGALREHQRRRGREPKLPGFEEMTPEQLFFLAYGNLWCEVSTPDYLQLELEDEHAPQRLRARGALQNSADFARAFHCPPGAPMNPKQRCIIF